MQSRRALRARSPFALCAAGALAATAVALAPSAASAQETQDYRVQQGDTCPSIAQRLYGDVGRIDVIHQNNPGLGRLPHRLRPGQILRLPRSATGPAPSSAARVSFVRNEVNAFTPEQHRARRDESLSRGHRLGTLDQSSAEVTFIDETQLQLEENTLVVVLGRSAQRVDAGNASETRLERGTLRASLAALAGGAATPQPRQITVQTPSATAQVGAGSSLVNVDARASTRLSVHQGASSIRAAGRTVAVNEGFGSRADRGRAPRPPQPLPARPVWSTVFSPLVLVDGTDDAARVAVSAQYTRGSGGPAPVVWHVQLARDERFNDLLVDARVPAAVTNLDTRLGPGVYHARVAAVDADGFEGRPSEVSTVRVSAVTLDAGGPGRRASIRVTQGTFCSIDGAPLALVSGSIELSPLRRHTLRCAVDANGRGAIERVLGPEQSGLVTVRARAFGAEYDGPRGSRRVLVGVYDAVGQPVVGATLRARAPRGVTVEPLRASAQRGVYETVARWNGAVSAGVLGVFVGDESGANPSAELALEASAPPAVAPVQAPPPRPHVGLELAFAGDAMITFDPRFRTGLGVSLDARARIPAGPGLLLGARAGYLRFGCSGPVSTDPNVFCPPVTAATMSAPRNSIGIDTFDLGVQVGAYLARHNAPVTGYVTFVPQWIFQRTSVVRGDGSEVIIAGSTFSALAMAGAQLRIGPGGLFANLGYRGAVAESSLGQLPLGGLLFTMGYRAIF
ncbi:MAG: LysM peptidoglycan-binding domain-containing protein [Myxococcales bacterium]|nr:LysM peptidoglycan-binding domain-containing protein [Myxococcales bacterium]